MTIKGAVSKYLHNKIKHITYPDFLLASLELSVNMFPDVSLLVLMKVKLCGLFSETWPALLICAEGFSWVDLNIDIYYNKFSKRTQKQNKKEKRKKARQKPVLKLSIFKILL